MGPTDWEVKGRLCVAASSQTGRSQQAVDPVGHPSVEAEVPLKDATRSIVHEDLSLRTHTRQRPLLGLIFTGGLATHDGVRPSAAEGERRALQSPRRGQVDQVFSVDLKITEAR